MELKSIYILSFVAVCFLHANADPEFCTRGFKMASRFYKCWEQATFVNKYPPLHEPHPYLDSQFLEAYATHMCSVVKPQALKCLDGSIQQCSNKQKLMDMADHSGGACLGNRLNPFFKTHVIDRLTPLEGDSPCFELADNTYECYKAAGQSVMQDGIGSDDIVTFHKDADKFFNAYWECMVEIYKSNEKICPNWQIPMLLTLQKTAMPSLFGLRLRPDQISLLDLAPEETGNETDVLNPGPSKLYLLLQLRKNMPDVRGDEEDSIVLEVSDLNSEDPKLELEQKEGEKEPVKIIDPRSFTLKELKALLREQRRRNKELKEFLDQAKQGLDKNGSGRTGQVKTKKMSWKGRVDKKQKGGKKVKEQKRLSLDSMIA